MENVNPKMLGTGNLDGALLERQRRMWEAAFVNVSPRISQRRSLKAKFRAKESVRGRLKVTQLKGRSSSLMILILGVN